jgi:membrane-bound serine protease (ClpP class)
MVSCRSQATEPSQGIGATTPRTPAHAQSRPQRKPAAGLIAAAVLLVLLVALVARVFPAPGGASTAGAAAAQVSGQSVWMTGVSGIIDPALANYLTKTMSRAAAAGAAALVVEIDTPGGLDSSMREIIQAELSSPIAIIFYVYPQGARAASAGTYILMGSDVAAMAPQTNLGAAHPVAISGSLSDVENTKVTNDAVAYITALASTHGRNATWAAQAVTQSVSLAAGDAKAQNVIDVVAPDLVSLQKALDGFTTKPKGLVLHLTGLPVKQVRMSWWESFLHAVVNPDLAYILVLLGLIGLVFGFLHPGLHLSAIAGVIALVLAAYALAILPVSWIGITLIVLAFILYVAEVKITSHGLLGVLGTISLILGGLFLFNSPAGAVRVSWPVILIVAIVALLVFAVVVRKVAAAMRRPHATGLNSLVGATGVVRAPLAPLGQVKVKGELWRARAEEGELLKDERIEVLRTEGLTLIVRRSCGSDADSQGKQGQQT